MTFIKICGMRDERALATAVEAGAQAVGVLLTPGFARTVSLDTARELLARVPERIERVGVLWRADRAAIERVARELPLTTVQLHGPWPRGYREWLSGVRWIRVVAAAPGGRAPAMPRGFERLLVDARVESGRGGTGRQADWALAARWARRAQVVLAGGLGPENVRQALDAVRPFGVDVASGIEEAGHPSPERIRAFIAAVRRWDDAMAG